MAQIDTSIPFRAANIQMYDIAQPFREYYGLKRQGEQDARTQAMHELQMEQGRLGMDSTRQLMQQRDTTFQDQQQDRNEERERANQAIGLIRNSLGSLDLSQGAEGIRKWRGQTEIELAKTDPRMLPYARELFTGIDGIAKMDADTLTRKSQVADAAISGLKNIEANTSLQTPEQKAAAWQQFGGQMVAAGLMKPEEFEPFSDYQRAMALFPVMEFGADTAKLFKQQQDARAAALKYQSDLRTAPGDDGLTPKDRAQIQMQREKLPEGLTEDALNMEARRYAVMGSMAGMGRLSPGAAMAIRNQAARLYPDIDLGANQADYKADSASLLKMKTSYDAIKSFEKTTQKNLDVLMDAASKIPDTGIPLLNKPIRALSASLFGSETVPVYNAARLIDVNEIAKVTSNPNMTGVLSDSARHEVSSLVPSEVTIKQLVSLATVLRRDMDNRRESLEEQMSIIQDRIRSRGEVPGGTPASTQGAQGGTAASANKEEQAIRDYQQSRSAQPNAPGGQPRSPRVGGKVMLKNGQTVTIKKINADGSFEY